MERETVIILLSFVCLCYSSRTSNNNGLPPMPLSYFRSSGIQDSMANGSSFAKLYIEKFATSGIRARVEINTGNTPGIKVLGSAAIHTVERSALASNLNHAGCDPYDQIVSIPNNKPNVLMYPSCVLLKQCGGCCGHPSLACKPTNTQDKVVQVMKYVFDGSAAHPVQQVDYVQMEEHTGCQCQCKLTESECNAELHIFDQWECKCKCKSGRQTCASNKRWDEDVCACRCADVQNCGTGYRYNMITCSCEESLERGADINNGRGDVGRVPAEVQDEVVTVDPCVSLNCPRRYKAVLYHRERCICQYDRSQLIRGRR